MPRTSELKSLHEGARELSSKDIQRRYMTWCGWASYLDTLAEVQCTVSIDIQKKNRVKRRLCRLIRPAGWHIRTTRVYSGQ